MVFLHHFIVLIYRNLFQGDLLHTIKVVVVVYSCCRLCKSCQLSVQTALNDKINEKTESKSTEWADVTISSEESKQPE